MSSRVGSLAADVLYMIHCERLRGLTHANLPDMKEFYPALPGP